MSKRNRRDQKAERRQERASRDQHPDELVQVQTYDELVGQAERGETLPCGCNAHELLHEMLHTD